MLRQHNNNNYHNSSAHTKRIEFGSLVKRLYQPSIEVACGCAMKSIENKYRPFDIVSYIIIIIYHTTVCGTIKIFLLRLIVSIFYFSSEQCAWKGSRRLCFVGETAAIFAPYNNIRRSHYKDSERYELATFVGCSVTQLILNYYIYYRNIRKEAACEQISR